MNTASWFVSTFYVASIGGAPDAYGKPTYAAPRAVKGRVEPRRRRVVSTTGEDVVSTHVLYTAETINPDDRIWLPGVSTAQVEGSRKPLNVTISNNKTGTQRLVRVDL